MKHAYAHLRAALLAGAALLCNTASAQTISDSQMQQALAHLDGRFNSADANKDGCVSKVEAKGKMPHLYRNFETIDTTRKGCVTIGQVKNAMQTHAAQIKEKRGAP
jgi:Ca2+-binding EF-hand superfamily protein